MDGHDYAKSCINDLANGPDLGCKVIYLNYFLRKAPGFDGFCLVCSDERLFVLAGKAEDQEDGKARCDQEDG